ncbi:MAG: hypothetical protein Tsb0015_13390 [Simkaniaceae bacterium]
MVLFIEKNLSSIDNPSKIFKEELYMSVHLNGPNLNEFFDQTIEIFEKKQSDLFSLLEEKINNVKKDIQEFLQNNQAPRSYRPLQPNPPANQKISEQYALLVQQWENIVNQMVRRYFEQGAECLPVLRGTLKEIPSELFAKSDYLQQMWKIFILGQAVSRKNQLSASTPANTIIPQNSSKCITRIQDIPQSNEIQKTQNTYQRMGRSTEQEKDSMTFFFKTTNI